MSLFSAAVREQAEAVARIYPGDAGLVEAVEAFAGRLGGLPSRFDVTFDLELTPAALGDEPNETFARLLDNLHGWLGYLLFTSAFKFRHLLAQLARGLNDRDFFAAVSAARMLMEHTAVLHYHGCKLTETWAAVREASARGDSGQLTVEVVACINGLLDYAKLTRLNWDGYLRGDFDSFFSSWGSVAPELLQKNILTLVDKLPQHEKGARFRYELLCEYVHPNAGAHTLSIAEATPLEGGRIRYVLEFAPQSGEPLRIVLHLLSSAVTSSLKVADKHLGNLEKLLPLVVGWASTERCVSDGAPGGKSG